MKILAIDTSCDETSVAVTEGTTVYSNVLWSQASLHAKFGGVYPSLAKREHEKRIDWVINRALASANCKIPDIKAIAVTVGPGLAIALEVGINKAKEIAKNFDIRLIPVNHIEGHLLSPLAKPASNFTHNQNLTFPALAFIASGKHTDLIFVHEIGKYEILASTMDDALGEALDKAARMMGLGYPGGPVLEKFAKEGDLSRYLLPVPLIGQESKMVFSYSGLKTAMYKLVESQKPLNKEKINDLSASFQNVAFRHVERILKNFLEKNESLNINYLLFGGGVSANVDLRRRLRKICKEHKIQLLIPYSKKLCTDNAAMIGVAAFFKLQRGDFLLSNKLDSVERLPRWSLE